MNKIFANMYKALPRIEMKSSEKEGNKGAAMQEVSELIGACKNANDYNEIQDILTSAVEDEKIEQLDEITYKKGDYIIQNLLTHSAEPQALVLRELSKKDLSIAPKFVDAITKGDYTLLITKIDGMEDENLIPFTEGYNLLDDEAKRAAFRDVSKLAQIGLANQAFFQRGSSALFITPKDKRIVIPVWKSLRPVDNLEKQGVLNTCHEIIFRK